MKRIILFGAASAGLRMLNLLNHEVVVAFTDNDVSKHGKTLKGIPIVPPSQIKNYEFDTIIISTMYVDDVRKQLIDDLGVDKSKVIDYFMDGTCDIRVATLRVVADEIYARKVLGNVAELGVFQGDFAKYINLVFHDRKLYLFDTFEGFNPKDVNLDIKQSYSDAVAGEYCNNSIDAVLEKMKHKENCLIKKGYFPESIGGLEDSFAFVSLDVDLYQPTYEGLAYFYPRLASGGYIFVHDYNNERFIGAKQAVQKYCKENGIGFLPISDIGGGGSIVIAKG